MAQPQRVKEVYVVGYVAFGLFAVGALLSLYRAFYKDTGDQEKDMECKSSNREETMHSPLLGPGQRGALRCCFPFFYGKQTASTAVAKDINGGNTVFPEGGYVPTRTPRPDFFRDLVRWPQRRGGSKSPVVVGSWISSTMVTFDFSPYRKKCESIGANYLRFLKKFSVFLPKFVDVLPKQAPNRVREDHYEPLQAGLQAFLGDTLQKDSGENSNTGAFLDMSESYFTLLICQVHRAFYDWLFVEKKKLADSFRDFSDAACSGVPDSDEKYVTDSNLLFNGTQIQYQNYSMELLEKIQVMTEFFELCLEILSPQLSIEDINPAMEEKQSSESQLVKSEPNMIEPHIVAERIKILFDRWDRLKVFFPTPEQLKAEGKDQAGFYAKRYDEIIKGEKLPDFLKNWEDLIERIALERERRVDRIQRRSGGGGCGHKQEPAAPLQFRPI